MTGLAIVAEESAEHTGIAGPAALGLGVFAVLMILLFVVTRFDPDR